MGGPLTSLDANRHTKVRDGVKRKKLIQQAKKKWIASATAEAAAAARTSKSGDLNSAEESAGLDESVNIKYTIDTIGEGC